MNTVALKKQTKFRVWTKNLKTNWNRNKFDDFGSFMIFCYISETDLLKYKKSIQRDDVQMYFFSVFV